LVKEASRLTAMMARCADSFAADDDTDPAYPVDAQTLAVLDARSALRHAAARMHTAAGLLGNRDDDERHPAEAHLASATAYLTAGHDLLQSHFDPGQSGARQGNSLWAPAIVSTPVSAALITAMGGYADRLASWMIQFAATPPSETLPAPTQVPISGACRWLRIAEAAAWAISRQLDTAAGQALLGLIPVNVPPPRRSPHGHESVPGLCTGAVATAERLRHLAHVPAPRPGSARTGMAVAWQRTAQGAAITGHCSEMILRQLAESTAEFSIPPAASVTLKEASHQIGGAWAAWRAVACEWDTFTTGPGATLTPISAAIDDLTLWVGRLAYTNPAWTPARNHASSVRTGTALSCEGGGITDAVASLHQVGDALAHIVVNDRENVRLAAAAGDLYVPTRLLPAESDVPHRYVPALPAMTDALLTRYDFAIQAAIRAVTALDSLALALNPQPTAFATLRAIAPLAAPYGPHSPAIPSAGSTRRSRPGRVEQELRRCAVNEPTLLARATDIDDAAQDLLSAAIAPSQRRAAAHRAALQAPEDSSTRSQHPARLATKDVPRTTSNTALPRLVPINHQIRHRPTNQHRQTL
jgi:hypothetical protein